MTLIAVGPTLWEANESLATMLAEVVEVGYRVSCTEQAEAKLDYSVVDKPIEWKVRLDLEIQETVD